MNMSNRWAGALAYLRLELPQFFSVMAFLVVTALLFRSWEFALIVTASLGFHELGHAVMLTWFRLEYRIFFNVVGAYTWSSSAARGELSQLANTYVHLAGPLFSLLLALIAMVLYAVWQPESEHLLLLANFSAQVGFLNLLPLGMVTDGGKALRRMAVSVRTGRGRSAVLLLSGGFAAVPAAYALLDMRRQPPVDGLSANLLGLLLVGTWLVAGVLAELRRSGPTLLVGRRPMNPRQVAFVTILMWDLLAVQLLVMQNTPFWLSPDYMMGVVENVKVVVGWMIQYVL